MNRHTLRRTFIGMTSIFLLSVIWGLVPAIVIAGDSLEKGWSEPPRDAKLRAYWWWLNGCVTKQAITRDLEEMRAKGFGGALICDADGSAQDGNERAPHGPDFMSPAWRELYRHALQEADRLGLEMSLNIQSGWNLGGPMVTPDYAAKKLVWSEIEAIGPKKMSQKLPQPAVRDGYYRDAILVAIPIETKPAKSHFSGQVTASSSQEGFPVTNLQDGDLDSFWVSGSKTPAGGPTRQQPVWLKVEFEKAVLINRISIRPRPEYGPRECELQVSEDGKEYRSVKTFQVDSRKETVLTLPATRGSQFQLLVYDAFDRGSPEAPRNVQIAEMSLAGPDGIWPDSSLAKRPIRNWRQKAGHESLHFSAPDTSLLLEQEEAEPGEQDALSDQVVDLSERLDQEGTLHWNVPPGQMAGSSVWVYDRQPLLCFNLQRRLGRTISRCSECRSFWAILGCCGGPVDFRCGALGRNNAKISSHGQLGSRTTELDTGDARRISQALWLQSCAVDSSFGRPHRGRS
jgi:hypothetical protein